ncbi:hypothetical protein [Pseudonocardia sp. DSM 110487]|uniref:hypothetical protein n=1 Tax=Pseudonocardia sp. DSM 110487 TaxID=2865833 RepID=UPI0021058D30|nr:hypothetical protein [Pseudonocardia sp. DSM 110487]
MTGKTAIVTGGSKGIGLALVRTLLAEGTPTGKRIAETIQRRRRGNSQGYH